MEGPGEKSYGQGLGRQTQLTFIKHFPRVRKGRIAKHEGPPSKLIILCLIKLVFFYISSNLI